MHLQDGPVRLPRVGSITKDDRWTAEWLAGRGVTVPERRLNRWRLAGLWPPEYLPADAAEAQFRMLDEMHGRGGSVEHMALVLAAAGHGCEALRSVLRDRLTVALPADEARGSRPSRAEELASELDVRIDGGATLGAGLWRKMRARVRDAGPMLPADGSVAPDYPSEHVWQSFAVDLFEAMLGGAEPFEREVLGTAVGAPDGDLDAGSAFMRAGRELHDTALRIIEEARVEKLAAFIADVARPLVVWVDRHDGAPQMDDETVTLIAAMLTPYLLAAWESTTLGPLVAARFAVEADTKALSDTT
jgi:hypothetical protein